jgi:hypothetical protein
MGHRNLVIAGVTALVVTGGGVALGQATADDRREQRGPRDRLVCIGPEPRTAREREMLRKLEEQIRAHKRDFPEGWVVGEPNCGVARRP